MAGFTGMPGIQARVNRPFNEDFRCYSMAMFPGAQRTDVDYGGKGIFSVVMAKLSDPSPNSVGQA